jgi:two-component system response regulator FixJ
MKARKKRVFIVDDEPSIKEILTQVLEKQGYEVWGFPGAEACLTMIGTDGCDLLITDIRMDGMDGLTLLERVRHIAPWIPVIMVTGYGDIPMAVRAMKLGAADFVEKPLDRDSFLEKVHRAINAGSRAEIATTAQLTNAEKKVLKLILQGKSNTETAHLLNRRIRTIELHRSNIKKKFGVDNIVDLVKKASGMDL